MKKVTLLRKRAFCCENGHFLAKMALYSEKTAFLSELHRPFLKKKGYFSEKGTCDEWAFFHWVN